MTVGILYLIVAAIGIVLAAIAYFMNRTSGKFFVAFTLMEIVIMAIIGVINGVLGTPNAMLGRLFMTFSGSYGFLAFAAVCGGFYISGPLAAYIIRKPGAATIAETLKGGGQVLSGNPNGVMVLGAGFLQGFMSDLGFAFYGYRKWTLSVLALSGALAPLLQQIPEVYFLASATWASATTCSLWPSAWSAAQSTRSFSSSRLPTPWRAPVCCAARRLPLPKHRPGCKARRPEPAMAP